MKSHKSIALRCGRRIVFTLESYLAETQGNVLDYITLGQTEAHFQLFIVSEDMSSSLIPWKQIFLFFGQWRQEHLSVFFLSIFNYLNSLFVLITTVTYFQHSTDYDSDL